MKWPTPGRLVFTAAIASIMVYGMVLLALMAQVLLHGRRGW